MNPPSAERRCEQCNQHHLVCRFFDPCERNRTVPVVRRGHATATWHTANANVRQVSGQSRRGSGAALAGCTVHARGWIRSRRRRGARCPLIWAASLLARTPLAPMQPSATPERAPGAHRGWCSPDAPERLAAFHELYHPLALHMRADTAANCSRTAAPPATASSDERDPALVHAVASLGQAQLVIMGFRRSATLQLHFQLAFAPCRAPARQLSTPLTYAYAGCSAARC